MKKLILLAVGFGLMLTLSCNKNEKAVQPQIAVSDPTLHKLKLNGAGDHRDMYITCLGSGMVLEIGSTSLINGGTANQTTYLGAQPGHANQKWKIIDQGNGFYKLMNLGSGKYLEAPATGTQAIQNQLNATDAQLWQCIEIGQYAYKVINKANGLALTDHGGSHVDSAPVTLEAYADNNSQYWSPTLIPDEAYRDDEVVRYFMRTSGSEAFDGGASIPLATGQSLWVTGDVYYNQLLSNGELRCNQIFNYHNSMLVQPASHSWDPTLTVNSLSPQGVQLFRPANTKSLIWPSAGVNLGSHAYIHGLEVTTGTLTSVNQYMCDVTWSGSGVNANTVIPLTIPGMSGQTAITYTLGMIKATDGYVYAYGSGGFLGASIFVARFPQSNIMTWTFWDGTTWAAAPTTASAAVVAQAPINNNAVSFINGKYVLISMDYGFTCDTKSHNMYSYTATSPTGPFTHKTLVYTIPDSKQGHIPVFYNPFIHPEFDNGQNELLVHYCVNFYAKNDGKGGSCLTNCSNTDGTEDPNDYRLKAVRIPYSQMGL
jgi:hypothetical protein